MGLLFISWYCEFNKKLKLVLLIPIHKTTDGFVIYAIELFYVLTFFLDFSDISLGKIVIFLLFKMCFWMYK